MRKQPFLCPKCGFECVQKPDEEIAGQVHEIHECRNYRCGLTWSPVKILNGKKEVTA